MRKDRRNVLSKSVPLTAVGTNTPVANTIYVSGISLTCTAAGASWALTFQDKATPTPNVIGKIATMAVTTTGPTIVYNGPPFPAIGGIDIVGTGTAGQALVGLNYAFD